MKKIAIVTLALFLIVTIVSTQFVGANIKFPDVPNNHWAKDDIAFLVERQIITGYPDGKFGLNDQIRRVDAAIMLTRALNITTTNRPNPGFKDVTTSSYAYNVIAAVAAEGLFTGNNDKMFQPNKTLTRAEMATILARAYKLESKSTRAAFTDVPTSFWGFKAIQALVENDITKGVGNNRFAPNQSTTRAEFASFMTRAIKHAEGNIPVDNSFRVITIY